jgi:pyruvate formate lyase activating enzyme
MARFDSNTAMIFDVQRFALHDGPGIRTTVFFKGCPLQCRWCQNPESHRPHVEMAFYRERYQACFLCETVCPEHAITHQPESRIDFSRCTACGACAATCSHEAIMTVGRLWTVDQLVAEIKKDRDFFETSGGGVTLSGGEPLMQADFLAQLLPALKADGIHITMETCGFFRWEHIVPLLPHLDLVYFDIKHMDRDTHQHLTRADNPRILDNFSRLLNGPPALQARMPLIPGMNDDPDNIRATARFLRQNHHYRIHCLPYHNFGEAKLARLQTPLAPLGLDRLTPERRQWVEDIFDQEGIHADVYD